MVSENQEEKNYMYLLRCADGTFYCGWTNHLEARVEAHNAGKGAKYTKAAVRWLWFTGRPLIQSSRPCSGNGR